MIRGYPSRSSVRAGHDLTLHVSTDSPRFRVDLYRCGASLTFQGASEWLDGQDVPQHPPYEDWGEPGVGLRGEDLPGWPAYVLAMPRDWPPGAYVAMLIEGDADGRELVRPDTRTPDGRDSKALFVVTSATPAAGTSILYKLPLFTYHAYNQVSRRRYDPATRLGGWCLYTVPASEQLPQRVPPAVSLHRPGGGTGGTPWDISNFDPFDPTPRQTFVHWDAPFIGWLENNGYSVDYCTDLDLHRPDAPELLRRYRLLLSAGHDEYWSDAMRAAVEQFISAGANVAFFGGNTCWWRVTFDDPFTFRRVDNWSDVPSPGRPENTLTGVSFRNGGERDRDEYPRPVGYRVQHADHWVYAGTGLHEGDTFGGRADEYVVGYECDGAHFDRADLVRGRAVTPTGEDGTPEDFTILGVGDLSASGWGFGNKAATMGVHTDNGTVFTAATTDWPRVLASGESPAVEQITRNVLDRLAAR